MMHYAQAGVVKRPQAVYSKRVKLLFSCILSKNQRERESWQDKKESRKRSAIQFAGLRVIQFNRKEWTFIQYASPSPNGPCWRLQRSRIHFVKKISISNNWRYMYIILSSGLPRTFYGREHEWRFGPVGRGFKGRSARASACVFGC